MRTMKMLAAFGTALLMAGCVEVEPSPTFVVSLHPLYTREDPIFEPALVGTWVSENGEGTIVFQKSKDNAYDLFYTEEGVPVKLQVHLVRLGEFLFLDIFPGDATTKNLFFAIPVHTFLRISIEGDVLRLAMLDFDLLKGTGPQEKFQIAHEDVDWWRVLTAPTQDLQSFVLQHAEDTTVFSNPTEFHRENIGG